MDATPILRLGEIDRNLVRGSARVPSFHVAVKDVIMNSLSALSSQITVVLDFDVCGFLVADNGVGVSADELESQFGTWNHTRFHAPENNKHPQFKIGEGIAALRCFSTIELASRVDTSDQIGFKQMTGEKEVSYRVPTHDQARHKSAADVSFLNSLFHTPHGTLLRVSNLFSTMPVRRGAVRADREAAAVRELVRGLSVLHHAVSWTVLVGSVYQAAAAGTHTCILSLPTEATVAKRVLQLSGAACVRAMQEVSCSSGEVSVTGLLSPPLPECCGASRDCQLSYLNDCWLRNCDLLCAPLNALYGEILLARQGRGGMTAMHASEGSAELRCCPRFVLHVSCPAAACDLLEEPEGTVALLACEAALHDALKRLVDGLVSDHLPARSSGISVLPEPACAPLDVDADGADPNRLHHYAVCPTQHVTTAVEQCNASSPLFKSAFFPGPSSSPRQQPTDSSIAPLINPAQGWQQASPYGHSRAHYTGDAPWQASCPYAENSTHMEAPTTVDAMVTFGPSDCDLPHSPTLKRQRLDFAEVSAPNQVLTYALSEPQDRDPIEDTAHDAVPSSPAVRDQRSIPPVEGEESYGSYVSHSRAQTGVEVAEIYSAQLLEARSVAPPAAPARTVLPAVMSKSCLKDHLRFFGQLQNEFLLAGTCSCSPQHTSGPCVSCADSSLLLLFDQHAVDERIRVEELMREVLAQWAAGSLSLDRQQREVVVQHREATTLALHRDVIQSWGFRYSLQEAGRCDNMCRLTVTSSPSVLGQALTAADLTEFLRMLAESDSSIPPAVLRIVSSKACKAAVKFGDSLSRVTCLNLLQKLVHETDLPFQCAHGRPSVSPLVDLREIRKLKMQSMMTALQPTEVF